MDTMAHGSKKTLQLLIIIIGIFCLVTSNAVAEKRVALVIGNSNYQNTSPLKNPVNDANLMASSLEQAGFEVTKILDADYRTLKRAMLEFGRNLRSSPEAGLFYYAGHGVQVRGENYLIPVNARISDEDEVDLEAININSFLRVMDSSSSAINIVVLDACRNNPFARSFRSQSRGLASVDAPKGTYIAYATAPGDVAADGKANNSPYSVALAEAISTAGLTIEQVFKRARISVLAATDNKQVPWETSSITGDFYFHKQQTANVTASKDSMPVTKPPVVQNILPSRSEAESVYKQVKDTQNIEVLEIFTKQYPDSIYTKFVLVRISLLRQAEELAAKEKQKILRPVQQNQQDVKPKKLASLEPMTESKVRSIQSELNRIGCVAGSPDGKWGPKARRALANFSRHGAVRYSSNSPTQDLLDDLRSKPGRVCPLVCGSRYNAVGKRCVLKSCSSGQTLNSSGICKVNAPVKTNSRVATIKRKRTTSKNLFGSIYFSQSTGTHGYSYDYSTQNEAEQRALKECRSAGGKDCVRAIWFRNACGALAVGDGNGWGSHWGENRTGAKNKAMKTCRGNASSCKIIRLVCTAGL
jgi:hypothetical protein